jgi:toxin ParE1/3/4
LRRRQKRSDPLLTCAASEDVLLIWVHIAEDNVRAADALVDTFDQKLTMLADSPGLGQLRPELAPALRSFPVGKYLLFYREAARGKIELVRVIHGARDLPTLFGRGASK